MTASKRKDFTQTAFDVVQRATGETTKGPPKPKKQTAPKVAKDAVKKAANKPSKARQ
jgi:hypothetical protein